MKKQVFLYRSNLYYSVDIVYLLYNKKVIF